MKKIIIPLLLTSILSCTSVQKSQQVDIPELSLHFNGKEITLSNEAEDYIKSVVAIMKSEAIYRKKLNFDEIQAVIRYYANGAETVADTHQAIKKALPLLKDHHSYFMSSMEIRQLLGLNKEDIEEIKNGNAPHIADHKLDSLKKSLDFASGKIINGNVGYLSIPFFDNLYREAMTMFADSLQVLIRQFDKDHVRGWVVDLRDNDGGAAMPMIAGLGPLLDEKNSFYTVDEEGRVVAKAFYKNGGYYDVSTGEKDVAPQVESTINYRLSNDSLPVAVLTNFMTASSAEAVTAIFAGQSNVKIIGSKTNGLTSTNDFNFLEDNSALNLTIGYYANRHLQIYRQGIDPDVEVKAEPKSGETKKNDIVLKYALDWINNEIH